MFIIKRVLYLHFGPQCHGYRYMGQQAEELAKKLGMTYSQINVEEHPEYAERYRVFFPGEIIVDDFKLVYPGTAAQLAQSYELKGPIPGSHTYRQRPHARPDTTIELPECSDAACGICIKRLDPAGVTEKAIGSSSSHSAGAYR